MKKHKHPITYEDLATLGVVMIIVFLLISAMAGWKSWLEPRDTKDSYAIGCNFGLSYDYTSSTTIITPYLDCSNGNRYYDH